MAKEMAKRKKRAGSGSAGKKVETQTAKSRFIPDEMRFSRRFITSKAGRWIIAILAVSLLLILDVLIAGKNADLFFVLTGVEGLVGILLIGVLLLYRRASKTG
ncbi:MAG TPA: hypothetical protein PKH23_05855 [Bacillota bacterium]|nr:hypothetical protein [Bacillota bacterium]